jgi:hypothetical protein
MTMRKRRLGMAGWALLAPMALLATGCASSAARHTSGSSSSCGALDYYPLLPGRGWAYEVEREGATVLALYRVADWRADLAVVQHGEERIEYALLPDGIARREGGLAGDYLLRGCVRAGSTWPVAAGTATVAEVGKTATLPAGTFHDCAVIEEVRREPNRVTRTTYCRDVGPVEIEMRVFSPLKQAYEVHVRARIMSVSRPESEAAVR